MYSKKFPFVCGYRHLQVFAALLLIASANLALTAQTPDRAAVTIKNFGSVNERYYRGSQPFAENFAELKRLGVKTVVDLRADKEEGEAGWARTEGLQYFNIPLTTKRPATEEQVGYFLKLVADPANWPVYVHCKGGKHRTGEMTAIYRITHDGWTADQAYEEMKRYDFEDGIFYPKSLKKYVFSFYERFAAGTSKADASEASSRLRD